MSAPLYKSTIVIWSEWEPTLETSLADLAHEAIQGDAYCSVMRRERVQDPSRDPDWDGTDFFLTPEETLA